MSGRVFTNRSYRSGNGRVISARHVTSDIITVI